MVSSSLSLRQQIAQKLMIDLRFYSEQRQAGNYCQQPVTQLPSALAELVSHSDLGGVILFAENCQDNRQLVMLTQQLQQAAAQSQSKLPLLLSIDQEGGRVVRTARAATTAFTGNMSIGATHSNHGTYFASASAEVIANELSALGLNCNHAPVVDVNANPDNPVINIRSFGESPQQVAELGLAQVLAFESQGMISTIKHFPGHGDTATDSHTGMPLVGHDLAKIEAEDLWPFRYIIDRHPPGMVMTAHIQYPALDSSTFVASDGATMIKPATMSRAIITDLLRQQMNYAGVVITDAMDMAGIAAFMTPHQAVINTFLAGVDIALMPIKVRGPEDIGKLEALIDAVVAAVEVGVLDATEIAESCQRIIDLKQRFKLAQAFEQPLWSRLAQAQQRVGCQQHRQIEQALAQAAITQVAGAPMALADNIAIVMPDLAKAHGLGQALAQHRTVQYQPSALLNGDMAAIKSQIASTDMLIAGFISPRQSAAELGGIEDLAALDEARLIREHRPEQLRELLEYAKSLAKPVVYISLRAPYDVAGFAHCADWVLASFAYNIDTEIGGQYSGPSYQALAKVLCGLTAPTGQLPVTVTLS